MTTRALLFLLLIYNVSCGGSSSSSKLSTEANNSSNTNTTDCGLMGNEACEAFKLSNQERIAQGIDPLQVSNNCVAAAQFHAEDMSNNGYFSHDGLNETWSARMRRFGVNGSIGENIAISGSPSSAMLQWMNSPGHRRNILNSSYKYSGMGYFSGHWVQCFSSSP